MLKRFAAVLALAIAFSGIGAVQAKPISNIEIGSKYKSCSYPKGPNVVRPPNALSWEQQGLTNSVKGIDVSTWQHPSGKAIDFAGLKAKYGISFVIIKAGDGSDSGNATAKKWYAIDRKAAVAQGLTIGTYYYALPGNLSSNLAKDAKLQAARAVRQSDGGKVGDIPITLDMEELPCGWTTKQLATWTNQFLSETKRLCGRTPMIYMNGTFIKRIVEPNVADFSGYPLWVAKWGPKLGADPGTLSGWTGSWKFWQFTADGKLTGVPSKSTDLDVFNGSAADFQAFISK